MSTHTPPVKERHLRLVPPLEPDSAAEGPWPSYADLPALMPAGLARTSTWARGVRPGSKALTATLVGIALMALGTASWLRPNRARRVAGPPRAVALAAGAGPTFAAFARQREAEVLGRPLAEGDPLAPDEQLVLRIHNAPGSGAEAAQYAAVFAMDAERHVATLYPTQSDATWAMPLPQVAALALLDGPQLSVSEGPITLITLFLRAPIALATAKSALRHAAGDAESQESALKSLGNTVVRLQRLTLVAPPASRTWPDAAAQEQPL